MWTWASSRGTTSERSVGRWNRTSLPAQIAANIVERQFGKAPTHVTRFPTGLVNYVYDVALANGERVVVRLGRAGNGAHVASAVYWHRQLRPLGVPLPRLLGYDTAPAEGAFPFMLLERLPGRDLEFAYPTLSLAQKRALARRIVAIQRAAAVLPAGPGFGYARSYTDKLHPTWAGLLEADFRQNLRRIEAAALVDLRAADQVWAKLAAYAPYLARITPRLFLDDTTTKNVLIHNGHLSGIVDVDVVCFGDRLLTPALTQMALLSRGYDTDYIRYWCEELDLRDEQERVLTLYTALFCVGFLGELGQQFNKDTVEKIEADRIQGLLDILGDLLARC